MAKSGKFSKRLIAITIVGSFAVIALAGWAVSSVVRSTASSNPFAGLTPYVYPQSSAAIAAESATDAEKAAFDRIASSPTAIWLLPEEHSTSEIGGFISSVSETAAAASQVPVFVVYGIPNRDCSNESAGGLTAEEYPGWISAIADGLTGHAAIVILEPDSLALSSSCGNVDERAGEINSAIDTLVPSEAAIYLDGGHSNWLSAADQATLLTNAGVAKVRGFASNVSNFNPTADEKAYDAKVSELAGGAHYVIDTGRNGNGSNGEWCNPSGRTLGDSPTVVDDGTGLDALLWIKNPGESDGQCNGGPAAGEWWPAGALALAQ